MELAALNSVALPVLSPLSIIPKHGRSGKYCNFATMRYDISLERIRIYLENE